MIDEPCGCAWLAARVLLLGRRCDLPDAAKFRESDIDCWITKNIAEMRTVGCISTWRLSEAIAVDSESTGMSCDCCGLSRENSVFRSFECRQPFEEAFANKTFGRFFRSLRTILVFGRNSYYSLRASRAGTEAGAGPPWLWLVDARRRTSQSVPAIQALRSRSE